MDKLNSAILLTALHDDDPRVCAAAIRLSEPMLGDKDGKLLAEVLKLKDRDDVRLQWVLSVSAIKGQKAEDTLLGVLCDNAELPLLKDAALSGLEGREMEFLKRILADGGWDKETPGRRAILSALASATFRSAKAPDVMALFDAAAAESPDEHWRRQAMLAGITVMTKGQSKPSKVTLKTTPQSLLDLCKAKDPITANLAQAAEAFVRWPGMPKEDKPATVLTADQQESFKRGKVLFGAVCAQCHQPDGRGFEGKAPSCAIRRSRSVPTFG